MVITSEGILYSISNIKPKDKIREIFLFDNNFSYELSKNDKYVVILSTNTRKLHVKANSFASFVDFLVSIQNALSLSPYTSIHRYDSFAPIRNNAQCEFFIDGENYFQRLF